MLHEKRIDIKYFDGLVVPFPITINRCDMEKGKDCTLR